MSGVSISEDETFAPSPSANGNLLPDFIVDVRSNFNKRDLEYLEERGALTIPDVHLRKALIDCFCQYVYPTMPVVDLVEFLQALQPRTVTPGPKISILFFQAVMFSAAAFVSIDLLREAGFSSRRVARKVFYERAKV